MMHDYMTPKQEEVLRILKVNGGTMPMTDLRAELEKTFPARDVKHLYRTLRGMEKRELVFREDIAEGNKGRQVTMTSYGASFVRNV